MNEEGVKKEISVSDLFSNYTFKEKPIRQQLIDEAFDNCNKSLVESGREPHPIRFYAIRVNACCKTNQDCHYLLKACKKGIFSKVFFGATKTKKVIHR